MRVLIAPLIAPSTVNQAYLIKQLIESRGYECELRSTITIPDVQDENNVAFLWLTLASATFLGSAVAPYLMTSKPRVPYCTIEGIPNIGTVAHSNIPRMKFVAVSNFVAENLRKIGLNVVDIIHHAVDTDLCNRAVNTSGYLRQTLKEKYNDKCLLCFVGRHDPRKRLDLLFKAVKFLQLKGRDDFVLLLITDPSAKELLDMEGIKSGVYIEAPTGSLSYDRVLQFIAACDYLVFPSQSEGFGLPVLEANAVGRPVIHQWFPPLSEFSSQEFNFVWNPINTQTVPNPPTQDWIFHLYTVDMLSDMIEYAIDTYKHSREEYLDYCAKAKEHASRWDYRKIYPRLLQHLEIE